MTTRAPTQTRQPAAQARPHGPGASTGAALPAPNPAGLPAALQAGLEALSGLSMAAVLVHRNSSRPAQLQAQAFTQGHEIHLAPGQDAHLAHEAWHVVQQAQGRVRATQQAHGVAFNHDPQLEGEAQRMGDRALQQAARAAPGADPAMPAQRPATTASTAAVVQLYRTTAEWVASVFDQPSIRACRDAIGDGAFQHFLKMELADFQALAPFFKHQPWQIAQAPAQCGLLVPLLGTPGPLALMQEALTLTQYDPAQAPATASYLHTYQQRGPQALAAARRMLRAKGNDPQRADQAMTETEGFGYLESVRTRVQALGSAPAQQAHDTGVAANAQLRADHLDGFTDTSGVDLTLPDADLAQLLGTKRATAENASAISQNLQDRQRFIDGFKQQTGFAHDTTFTRNHFKGSHEKKLHEGLRAIFDIDALDRDDVKQRITARLQHFDTQQAQLPLQLPAATLKLTESLTKDLAKFSARHQKLGSDLGPARAKGIEALRLAVAPLFDHPDSEAAVHWVLDNTPGAVPAEAARWVQWLQNGQRAHLPLAELQRIFGIFTLQQLQALHAPTGADDAQAQAALRLLQTAKPGDAAKYATLVQRDTSTNFTELLALVTTAGGDIDRCLQIFSKADKSADVNQLLAALRGQAIANPLQRGQDYLQHTGLAADGRALVARNVADADALQLLQKPWIVGQAAHVATIYAAAGNDAARTIVVLDLLTTAATPRTPADVAGWLGHGHGFNTIHNKLQADKDQQFWSGQACTAASVPVVSRNPAGPVDTVATVIAHCTTDKLVGRFYSGGHFGNLGNGAGQPVVMVLPGNGYREYDIKPYADDPSRGVRRVVAGNGHRYYTADHYKTFQRIAP